MKNLFYSFLAVFAFANLNAQDTPQTEATPSSFFVTGNISYAYRTAKLPDGFGEQQKDYLDKLRSGLSFDLGAYYMIDDSFAIGLRYNNYHSKMSMDNIAIVSTPAGDSGFGSISDDITISYYGFSVLYLNQSGPHIFSAEAGLGYMDYRNDAEALGAYKFTGGNVGGVLTLGYKYAFSRHFAVGPQISLIGTALTSIDLEGPNGFKQKLILENENKESLTRIDLGITAMYRF